MKTWRDYDKKYPNLIIEIINYFSTDDGVPIAKKSVRDFCLKTGIKKGNGILYRYDPLVVNKICEKLCEKDKMSKVHNDIGVGDLCNYVTFVDKKTRQSLFYEFHLNALVYGFSYIYEKCKELVVPLVWKKKDGSYSVGTGFKVFGGIATAKHCVEDPENLSIKGYSVEELQNSKIYISENDNLDIAFIDVQRKEPMFIGLNDGEIMQEVLTMGYPKIPAFTDFLTAEKATISSKAESRITPTKGTIAAFGENYLSRAELMLITAKIRGGNSGGPVINGDGSIVGIACQIPLYDDNIGDYDDLGYGIVVPIKYLVDIIDVKSRTYDVSDDFYMEYIW